MIIDPATLMNVPAQNALLKTLEEPPQNSLLILIAPSGGGLLPTVRSRCLRISFGPLSRDLVARYLVLSNGNNAEDAAFLAAISMGSLGTALTLDRKDLMEMRRCWIDLLNSLTPGNYRAAIAAAEGLSADREESLKFLEWLESWYRDLLVHEVTRDAAEMINLDMLPQIERQSADRAVADILEVMRRAAGAAARIQRNLNRRMILEDVLLAAAGAR